jgi:hypothetical protein
MKKHGLRGLLLGVSMALLLAGGVALAQGLSVTVDQDCFECWPQRYEPDEEHTVVVTVDDYMPDNIAASFQINGALVWSRSEPGPCHGSPCEILLAVLCDDMQAYVHDDCVDCGVSEFPAEYGDWLVRVWQPSEEAEVAFRFAEVCEEEFVPEPGSIMLLGSGLAGLAAYAALRWRTRE